MAKAGVGAGRAAMGPQGERRAAWLQQGEELPAPPRERDVTLLETAADRRIYEQELAKVRSEKEFLKDQVNRLSKELRAYQIKYPTAHSQISTELGDVEGGDDLPPWVTNSDTMVPLIKAYDTRVAELEDQIQQQNTQLELLQNNVDNLVSENEHLREAQIDGFDQIFKTQQGAETVMDEELIKDLNERIAVLMAQNALMNDQTTVMGKELEQAHSDLEERDNTIQQLSSGLGEASNTLQYLEGQLEQLRAEKDQAETAVMKQAGEVALSQEEQQKLLDKLAEGEEELKQLKAQHAELQNASQEAQKRFETELDALAKKVQTSAAEVAEIRSKCAAKSQEANALGDQLRRVKRELETTRTDAEGMLKVMDGMDKQLTEYAAREEGVGKLSRESRQKVEDALLARDQARALEQQSRRELARALERRKADAEQAAADQEQAVGALRARLQAQIDARDEENTDLVAENASLQEKLNKAKRERNEAIGKEKMTKDNLQEFEESLEIQFNDLRNRIIEADRAKDEEIAQKHHLEEHLKELEDDFQGKSNEWRLERQKQEELLRMRERELENLRVNHRNAVDKAERKEKDAMKLVKELEALRGENRHRVEELVRAKESQMAQLRLEGKELESKVKEADRRVQEEIERADRTIEKIKSEKDSEVQRLQNRLKDESEVSQRLSARNQELTQKINVLATDNSQLRMDTHQNHDSSLRLEASLQKYQQQVAELTAKLTESISQQEATATENARFKAELKRAELEHERWEREKETFNKLLHESRAQRQGSLAPRVQMVSQMRRGVKAFHETAS